MDKKVTITNAQGQKAVANIITMFKLKDTNNDYVVYTFNQRDTNNNIKDYVSKLRIENGNYFFDTIVDEDEWSKVKKTIEMIGKGE